MKIATWNVNSIRVRITHIQEWLKTTKVDVLLLQELKAPEDKIPVNEIEDLGYNIVYVGQPSYNGVAIVSKYPLSDITTSLPGDNEDVQARYIEAWIEAKEKSIRIASVYLPNGNPVSSEKFTYKINWLKRLKNHAKNMLKYEEPFILGGDFNVCPSSLDVADVESMKSDALCQPVIRELYRSMLFMGVTDGFRLLHEKSNEYTYWDYGSSFKLDKGLRIDHLLFSPQALDRLVSIDIDKTPRSWEKPSDHTPLWCMLR